jgi:hypothetical protein
MIKPTIGRVVLIRRPENASQHPEAGLVTFVHHDTMINVAGFDHNGVPFARTSVFLDQGDEPCPQWALRSTRAEWMPYQKGQAAKTAQVEGDLEAARRMASAGEPLINPR